MNAFPLTELAGERHLLQEQLLQAYRTIGTRESEIAHLQQQVQQAHAREAFLVQLLQQNPTGERQPIRLADRVQQSHAMVTQTKSVVASSRDELAHVYARLQTVEIEQAKTKDHVDELQTNVNIHFARDDATHGVNGDVNKAAARIEDLIDVGEGGNQEATTPTIVNTSASTSFAREVPQGLKIYFDQKLEDQVASDGDKVEDRARPNNVDEVDDMHQVSNTSRVNNEGRVRKVRSASHTPSSTLTNETLQPSPPAFTSQIGLIHRSPSCQTSFCNANPYYHLLSYHPQLSIFSSSSGADLTPSSRSNPAPSPSLRRRVLLIPISPSPPPSAQIARAISATRPVVNITLAPTLPITGSQTISVEFLHAADAASFTAYHTSVGPLVVGGARLDVKLVETPTFPLSREILAGIQNHGVTRHLIVDGLPRRDIRKLRSNTPSETQPSRRSNGLAGSIHANGRHAVGGDDDDDVGQGRDAFTVVGGPVKHPSTSFPTNFAAKLSSASSFPSDHGNANYRDDGRDDADEDDEDDDHTTPPQSPTTVLTPRFLAACKQMKELRTSFILETYEDGEGRAHVVFENVGAAMWAGDNVVREFGYGVGVRVWFGRDGCGGGGGGENGVAGRGFGERVRRGWRGGC